MTWHDSDSPLPAVPGVQASRENAPAYFIIKVCTPSRDFPPGSHCRATHQFRFAKLRCCATHQSRFQTVKYHSMPVLDKKSFVVGMLRDAGASQASQARAGPWVGTLHNWKWPTESTSGT